MLNACEDIIDVIVDPKFIAMTDRGIPANVKVPNESSHTEFLVFDFGICENENGELEPQLIEMQGFPTLYAFQAFHSELTAEYAELPADFSPYLNGYNKETYVQLLKRWMGKSCRESCRRRACFSKVSSNGVTVDRKSVV